MINNKFPAMWQSNHKSSCSRQLFVKWVYETFGPQVKEYPMENRLPLKCIILIDNAIAHTRDLDDDLPDGVDFIKLKFLPPNATTHGPTRHL